MPDNHLFRDHLKELQIHLLYASFESSKYVLCETPFVSEPTIVAPKHLDLRQ